MILYSLRIFSALIFNKILKLPFLKFKNYFFPSLGTSPIHRHHFVALDANHCWETNKWWRRQFGFDEVNFDIILFNNDWLLMQKLSFSLMEKAFDSTFMNGGRRGAATAAMANGNDCSGWFDGHWMLLWLGLGED